MKRVAISTRILTSDGQQTLANHLQTILRVGEHTGDPMTVEEFKVWLHDLLASAPLR